MDKSFVIGETEAVKSLKYYEDNYDIIWIPCPEKLSYIDTQKEYVCRFCGKDKTQTTFRKKAHVIPEFLGNKTLRTKNECDKCNEKFGKLLEDNLAKFLLPYNSLTQVCGKNGVPTYIDQANNIRIKSINGSAEISNFNSPLIKLDEQNKSLTIQMQTQKIKPIKVYKAFLKMALSIMPENELINFRELIAYIQEEKDRALIGLSKLLVTFTPGAKPYKNYMNIILKKKNRQEKIPYMYYIFSYGNFMFQTMIPSSIQDKELFYAKLQFKINPFPSFYDFSFNNNVAEIITSQYKTINLSSTKTINSPLYFSMHYETIERI